MAPQNQRSSGQPGPSSSGTSAILWRARIHQLTSDVEKLFQQLSISGNSTAEAEATDTHSSPDLPDLASNGGNVRDLRPGSTLTELDIEAFEKLRFMARQASDPGSDTNPEQPPDPYASGTVDVAARRLRLTLEEIRAKRDETEKIIRWLHHHQCRVELMIRQFQQLDLQAVAYSADDFERCEDAVQGLACAIAWRRGFHATLCEAAWNNEEAIREAEELAFEELDWKLDEWEYVKMSLM